MNEEEPNTAPTDSRLRKDQRLMEETKWDEANTEKQVSLDDLLSANKNERPFSKTLFSDWNKRNVKGEKLELNHGNQHGSSKKRIRQPMK